MKAASLVEKTADMMVRMMDCLSVDAMASSLAGKTAEKSGVSLVEETADMMVMMLDCSSEVSYIYKPAQVCQVLPWEGQKR